MKYKVHFHTGDHVGKRLTGVKSSGEYKNMFVFMAAQHMLLEGRGTLSGRSWLPSAVEEEGLEAL